MLDKINYDSMIDKIISFNNKENLYRLGYINSIIEKKKLISYMLSILQFIDTTISNKHKILNLLYNIDNKIFINNSYILNVYKPIGVPYYNYLYIYSFDKFVKPNITDIDIKLEINKILVYDKINNFYKLEYNKLKKINLIKITADKFYYDNNTCDNLNYKIYIYNLMYTFYKICYFQKIKANEFNLLNKYVKSVNPMLYSSKVFDSFNFYIKIDNLIYILDKCYYYYDYFDIIYKDIINVYIKYIEKLNYLTKIYIDLFNPSNCYNYIIKLNYNDLDILVVILENIYGKIINTLTKNNNVIIKNNMLFEYIFDSLNILYKNNKIIEYKYYIDKLKFIFNKTNINISNNNYLWKYIIKYESKTYLEFSKVINIMDKVITNSDENIYDYNYDIIEVNTINENKLIDYTMVEDSVKDYDIIEFLNNISNLDISNSNENNNNTNNTNNNNNNNNNTNNNLIESNEEVIDYYVTDDEESSLK